MRVIKNILIGIFSICMIGMFICLGIGFSIFKGVFAADTSYSENYTSDSSGTEEVAFTNEYDLATGPVNIESEGIYRIFQTDYEKLHNSQCFKYYLS